MKETKIPWEWNLWDDEEMPLKEVALKLRHKGWERELLIEGEGEGMKQAWCSRSWVEAWENWVYRAEGSDKLWN